MQTIAQPQLPSELAQLTSLRVALTRDESLSGFVIEGEDLSGVQAKAVNISEARLLKTSFAGANLERMGFADVVLAHCDMTAVNCADSSWRRVKLTNMRGSGLKLQTTTLKDVHFEDCKLDLTNFRFSRLKNISFKNCILDETDFYHAELENVLFQNCSLDRTVFSSAKCKGVDLRSSEIVGIVGIEGLAGTTIDSVQLVSISQALANSLRIRVSDE